MVQQLGFSGHMLKIGGKLLNTFRKQSGELNSRKNGDYSYVMQDL